jgi:peroxiredoxin
MLRKISFYLMVSLLYFQTGIKGQGYHIQAQISGLHDTIAYLGFYAGDKRYICDTALINTEGKFSFSGDHALEQGLYFVKLPNKEHFDLLIGNEQKFSITSERSNYINKMIINGSEEGKKYFDYQRFMQARQKHSFSLQKRIRENKERPDSVAILNDQIKQIDKDVREEKNRLVAENRDLLIGKFIRATINPDLPKFDIPATVHNKDSALWFTSYHYNISHFFDNIDFCDERLLNTPIVAQKLNLYFTNTISQKADSLTKGIDRVMKQAEKCEKSKRFIVYYLAGMWQSNAKENEERAFIYLVGHYITDEPALWANDQQAKRLQEKTDHLKANMTGSTVPDISLQDTNDKGIRLYAIKKPFTILFFWDSKCDVCYEKALQLQKLYEKFKGKGVEVVAVHLGGKTRHLQTLIMADKFDWINVYDPKHDINFSKLFNLTDVPFYFLLDDDKKIIMKGTNIDELEKNISKNIDI